MTKKLFLALLAPALMGGLMACNKQANSDLDPEAQSTGDTYMSVTFTTANPNSTARAAVKEDKSFNSIGEYIGRDEIKNVNVYVINLPEETVELKEFDAVTDNPDGNDNTKDFRTDAWKTTAGEKIIYVYVNIKGTKIEEALNAATNKAKFEEAAKAAYELTENGAVLSTIAKVEGSDPNKKDIIAMAPIEPKTLTVTAGVTKDEAEKKPFDQAKNSVQVSVRRLVAQAAVTATAEEFSITENRGGAEKTLAKLTDLKWDAMQFEKTTYLTPKADGTNNAKLAEFCMSPSFSFLPTATNYTIGTNNAGDKYEYRAFTGTKVEKFTRSTNADAATKNKEDIENIVKNPMKFITETTHQLGGKLATDGGAAPFTGYREGNTTYVIVSAKITPDETAWADGQKAKYQDGKDLFFGVQDHKFYAEESVAQEANKPSTAFTDGRDNVVKYTAGRCYYVAWLNPNEKGADKVTSSPILRNNIYHVNITAIKKLGFSGNPYNPNGDDPQDPDGPNKPNPENPLYKTETFMSTEVIVVDWGVHSNDQEL